MAQRKYAPTHRTAAPGRKFDYRKAWLALYNNDTWRDYSKRFLAANPRCYACGKKSQAVDHVTPHQGDVKLFEATNNHIPICKSCHTTVTSLFDRNHAPGKSIQPKLNWIADTRARHDLTIRVKAFLTYG